MAKPKKKTLLDGTTVWEVYVRESGRGSKEIRRRFSSSKDAQGFLDTFKEETKKLREGHLKVGSFFGTTFREESENWLRNLKLRASPGHYRRCEDILSDFNLTWGRSEPNKITPEFLTILQSRLKERSGRKVGSNLSNASINRYTEAICAVLNFAASQRRIPFSPVAGFKKLPNGSSEMLFWDEREAGAFLTWTSRKYRDLSNGSRLAARGNYVAYLTALNTGMRAGEIWGLKPRDLCFMGRDHGDTIFVRRQLNRLTFDFAPLKGGVSGDKDKSRHVPCPPSLRKELEALVAFNGTSPDEAIFHNSVGGMIVHDAFSEKFERDVANWGGRRIRFHDLRHTAATLMLSKGVDVKTVSEILGHEDISTTMTYVHLLGDKIKQVSKSYAIVPIEAVQPTLNPAR